MILPAAGATASEGQPSYNQANARREARSKTRSHAGTDPRVATWVSEPFLIAPELILATGVVMDNSNHVAGPIEVSVAPGCGRRARPVGNKTVQIGIRTGTMLIAIRTHPSQRVSGSGEAVAPRCRQFVAEVFRS